MPAELRTQGLGPAILRILEALGPAGGIEIFRETRPPGVIFGISLPLADGRRRCRQRDVGGCADTFSVADEQLLAVLLEEDASRLIASVRTEDGRVEPLPP